MRLRFPWTGVAAIAAAAAALSLAPAHSWAQTTEDPPAAIDKLPNPPDKLPKAPKGDRGRNIDFLFDALKAAPDAEIAKQVENRIWAIWLASGSDTADLLMSRVKAAIEGKDARLAIQLLGSIIEIKPDSIEAGDPRATLFFALKDYGRAMAGIHVFDAQTNKDVGGRDKPGHDVVSHFIRGVAAHEGDAHHVGGAGGAQ